MRRGISDGHVIPGSPQAIEWSSDGSVTASGWELCATPLPDGPGLECLNTCEFAVGLLSGNKRKTL